MYVKRYVFKLEDSIKFLLSIVECNLLFRHGIHFCYICAITTLRSRYAVRYKLKLWEVRVNLRVHKIVSRIALIR